MSGQFIRDTKHPPPTCVLQVCEPHLNTLAHTLPFAHCSQSRLVCTISGAALNENNQPMMLPNGEETS